MYKPGPRIFRTIHPDLRAAVRAAIDEGNLRAADIALNAGFANAAQFSTQLHAPRIPRTDRVVERFRRVAALLTYTGDVFVDYPERQRA